MVRLVTPIVAATGVQNPPVKKAKTRISRDFSKASRPFANRVTKCQASTASRVLPVAIPRDVTTEPAVVRLTTKAPTRIAGQKRDPRAKSAAIAMPVGGQTGVALG